MPPPTLPTTPATHLTPDKAAQAILRRHHVQVLGAGQPTLLFCSGFNCNQQVWHYLTPALAAEHQLILFDQMGVGHSDRSA